MWVTLMACCRVLGPAANQLSRSCWVHSPSWCPRPAKGEAGLAAVVMLLRLRRWCRNKVATGSGTSSQSAPSLSRMAASVHDLAAGSSGDLAYSIDIERNVALVDGAARPETALARPRYPTGSPRGIPQVSSRTPEYDGLLVSTPQVRQPAIRSSRARASSSSSRRIAASCTARAGGGAPWYRSRLSSVMRSATAHSWPTATTLPCGQAARPGRKAQPGKDDDEPTVAAVFAGEVAGKQPQLAGTQQVIKDIFDRCAAAAALIMFAPADTLSPPGRVALGLMPRQRLSGHPRVLR
jgi:hypothetical protein